MLRGGTRLVERGGSGEEGLEAQHHLPKRTNKKGYKNTNIMNII